MRAVGPEVRRTYVRTIGNFVESNDFKRRRHALRLSINLSDLLASGRFNPVLSDVDKRWATLMAHSLDEDSLRELCWLTAYG